MRDGKETKPGQCSLVPVGLTSVCLMFLDGEIQGGHIAGWASPDGSVGALKGSPGHVEPVEVGFSHLNFIGKASEGRARTGVGRKVPHLLSWFSWHLFYFRLGQREDKGRLSICWGV